MLLNWASTFPKPTRQLQFAGATSIDSAITYTGSNGTYFNSSGVLTAATTNVARLDYDPSTLIARGLLIEEQRTNSIRNNTMVGASAGTPGTLPTNWLFQITSTTGLTSSIVGTGTENGINYLDFRLFGTAAGAGSWQMFMEGFSSISAATAQVWTTSVYWRMVSGSMTGLSGSSFQTYEYTSAPAYIKQTASNISAPTTGALNTQRQSGTVTLSGGVTTAFVVPALQMSIDNGAAIDITLRIGMPQLELGAFATSVISTSSAAVTRSADVASMTGTNFSSWYNQSQGTFVVRSAAYAFSASNNGVFAVGDPTKAFGAAETLYDVYATGASNQQTVSIITGGVGQATITPTYAPTVNSFSTLAVGYAANNVSASTGGSAVVTDTSVTLPTPTGMSIGSLTQGWSGGASYLNGWIQSIAYYPVRLPNSTLQALSA